MAQHHDHRDTMVPQETSFDNAEQPGFAQPYSQSEVEDLLYGDDRPASERLAQLRELRADSTARESADWGDQDPAALLDEIDRAIDELSALIANQEETSAYDGLDTVFDADPADRLDALAPDDVDARHAIESDDYYNEEDELGPLGDDEWDDSDATERDRDTH